ncbi:flavin-containing monooxygenase [Streptomyces sp. NPDC102279]|uniref:flavin-containing monooxygenase n=1 Tax=Streptomyces sp. NPDC102279 TaxID=3366153 RepID=UPI003822BDDE
MSHQDQHPAPNKLDVVVVGAGFAGLYQLHRLRGQGFDVRIIEAGDGVGGTWYWNRYPGARCDVRSVDYSYSFSPELEAEWEWSEKYAAQPEILRYLEHVADRFDLRRDIDLGIRLTAATFDETSGRWMIETDQGGRYDAQFLIMATGNLSSSRIPDIPGLDDFHGARLHTAQWPKEGIDLTGRRVGVIGTGSSGVQVIPELAAQADHVTVFQRTPAFALPANNRPLTGEEKRQAHERAEWRRNAARNSSFGIDLPAPQYKALEVDDAERRATYESYWDDGAATALMLSYRDLLYDREANETVAEFLRDKIKTIVDDPETARALTPHGFPFGAKRACVGTNYPAIYNEPHVDLVDVGADPIDRFTATGLRTESGTEHPLDAIVFATGFDAMTGALTSVDIRGREGVLLRDKWSVGPHNFLGVSTSGFPNMFIVTGPGSPSVLSNVVVSIEQHVDWITRCLTFLRDHRIATIDASAGSEADWVRQVNEAAARTLYPEGNSWYLGANVPGKPRVFMPYVRGLNHYSRICDEIAERGYDGFVLAPRPEGAASTKASSKKPA